MDNHQSNNRGNPNEGYEGRQRRISETTLKQRENAIRQKFSNWVKDEESKACFLCRKEFNFMYRRRHHCRKCGQLFCSGCSNYFLTTLIDPTKETDKETRMCKTCFIFCKEFLESHNEKNDEEQEDEEEEEEEEKEEKSRNFNKINEASNNKLRFDPFFEKKLKNLIQYVFSQEKKLSSAPKFTEEHTERTFEFILYCLKNQRGRTSRQQQGDQRLEKFHEMDINRYIMIKKCQHKDSNSFTFIRGIIISKNVAKKNMCLQFGTKKSEKNDKISAMPNRQNQNFGNGSNTTTKENNSSMQNLSSSDVKVMIISVSVDIFSHTDTSYPDLAQVIQKQRQYVTKIVEGIKYFKIHLLLCQENVHQDILASLEVASISVVQKIKPHLIRKIADCARCNIIQDIAVLLPQQNNVRLPAKNPYIGTLQSAYFKTFLFNANQKTFMFLEEQEKKEATQIVSLLITGPQIDILKQYKKSLQVMLRLAKHLFLEQEIIGMSNEMLIKTTTNKKQKKLYFESMEQDVVDFGNLSSFLDEKLGLQEFLYSDISKFAYAKIQYNKVGWDQFDGVSSKEDFERYISDKRINVNLSKIGTFVKYCGDFEHEKINFYSTKDISLGFLIYFVDILQNFFLIKAEFLMTIYFERNTTCSTCQGPMYNHYQLYVRPKSYVRFSITERMDSNIQKQIKNGNNMQQQSQNSANNFSKDNTNQGESKSTKYSNNQQNTKSEINSIQNKTQIQKEEKETFRSRRKNMSPKEPVFTYLFCEQCHQIITTAPQTLLGKAMVDYSYNRFLQHMFQEHCESFKKELISQTAETLAQIKDDILAGKEDRLSNTQGNNVLPLNGTNSCEQKGNQNTNGSVVSGQNSLTTINNNVRCSHSIKTRIFKIKDVEIKFQAGKTYLHTFQRLIFNSSDILEATKQADIQYYVDSYAALSNLFKSLFLDAANKLNKLMEISCQKKASRQSIIVSAQEKSKFTLESMEAERDYIFESFDPSTITNYKSVESIYVLECRIHIALQRLDKLIKEVLKRKFKQFEKHHLDEPQQQLDNSVIEDDLPDVLSAEQVRSLKEYQITMNVMEEKDREDEQIQPFVNILQRYFAHETFLKEYIPVYAKNQLSMMAWAFNTKQYGRYLKEAGLGNRSTKQFLIERMKKRFCDENYEEKQSVEENKLVVRMLKCHEMELLKQFDYLFSGLHLKKRVSIYECSRKNFFLTKQIPTIKQEGEEIEEENEYDLLEEEIDKSNTFTNFTMDADQKEQDINTLKEIRDISLPTNEDIMPQASNNNNYQHVEENKIIANSNNTLLDLLNYAENDQINKSEAADNQQSKEILEIRKSMGEKDLIPVQTNALNYDLNKQSQNKISESNPKKQTQVTVKDNINTLFFKSNVTPKKQQDTNSNQQSIQAPLSLPKDIQTSFIQQQNATDKQEIKPQQTPTQQKKTSLTPQKHVNLSQQIQEGKDETKRIEGVGEKVSEIVIYFARQFEAFRNLNGISLERIIESLRTCAVVRLPGGQTQSVFVKSHDELFIVKGVSTLEFGYFLNFASDYLEYMAVTANSILAKVFGMFEVKSEGEKKCYVVMENLFYGVDKDNTVSYDLKGSKKRRFTKGIDIGLDTNFMIDMNCEPFFIDNPTFAVFDKTLRNDSEFLANQKIVDYSLLLIADKNKRTLKLGIIDYFRKFDLPKYLEKHLKKILYDGDPTIIEPRKYQERFVKTLTKKFFCKI